LTDTFSDGETINIFESGSIMQYLVERYDTEYKISFPKGTREWYEMSTLKLVSGLVRRMLMYIRQLAVLPKCWRGTDAGTG